MIQIKIYLLLGLILLVACNPLADDVESLGDECMVLAESSYHLGCIRGCADGVEKVISTENESYWDISQECKDRCPEHILGGPE